MIQKLRQWMKKWSFGMILLLSGIVFFTWTDNWQIYTEPINETYCEGVQLAQLLADGKMSEAWEKLTKTGRTEGDFQEIPATENGTDTEPEASDVSGNSAASVTGNSAASVTGNEDVSSGDVQSENHTVGENTATDPATEQNPSEEPEGITYHTVDDSYFEDAVFIGDSRTVGMYEYGGLEETSTFYASTGLTIYKMFDSKIVTVPGQKKKITVEEALSEKQFAKIYLMIGINEMGTGTVESFMKAYGEAVEHLQELQPDAIIYLQAIMKVTAERSAQGDYITNEGIEARNAEIAKLADDRKLFYLDVNPLICDETGGMVASYTYDGVHLKAQYIPIWLDFLKEHAVSLPEEASY